MAFSRQPPTLSGRRPANLPDGGWGARNDAAAVLPSALTGRLHRRYRPTAPLLDRDGPGDHRTHPGACSGPRHPSLSPTATARTTSGYVVKPGRGLVQSLRRSADTPPDLTRKARLDIIVIDGGDSVAERSTRLLRGWLTHRLTWGTALVYRSQTAIRGRKWVTIATGS